MAVASPFQNSHQAPAGLELTKKKIWQVTNALALADDCTDDETRASCLDLGAGLCATKANEHTYDATKCATLCATASVAAVLVVPFPFGFAAAAVAQQQIRDRAPECYQGQTDFEKCFAEFTDVGVCRSKYRVRCSAYVYQRDDNRSPCTATSQTCAYGAEWEAKYREERGLPTTGFCPECVGSGGCAMRKSSKTYQVAQAGSRLHAFGVARAVNGDVLGDNAQYVRIGLGTLGGIPVQCGRPGTCGALRKAVEVRKGLFACVPCLAAPLTQCVGEHMCDFNNGTTLEAAYAATAAWLGATATGVGAAGLEPRWYPWLEPRGFEEYSPTSVAQGFNEAILRLGGQCRSENGGMPDPSQCQNDAPRRALAAHVDREYRVAEGVVVPGGHSLGWSVTRAMLTTFSVPAWEMVGGGEEKFVRGLLSDAVCRGFTYESLVCLQRGGATMVFNPLIAGDFEVQEGCDTSVMDGTRVISSACNQLACPLRGTSYDEYNLMEDGGNPTSAWTACKRRDHATPGYFTSPSSAPTNLCGRVPVRPAMCGVGRQGVLGGREGWKPVTDLYARGAHPFGATTSLAELVRTKTSNLAVGVWDMGGHHVRLGLTAARQLVVRELPLRSFASLTQAMGAAPAGTTWAQEWAAAPAGAPVGGVCATWACPLKRRAYWNGRGPMVPDGARTRAIFGTSAHPSTAPQASLYQAGSVYLSRNGLCLCRQVCGWEGTGNCSRTELIEALWDGRPRLALVLETNASRRQLDWPWSGGRMRDGLSSLPNRVPGVYVLDRLPAFRYRFARVAGKLPQPQTSTLDEGGDCHMGRAARGGQLDGCVVVNKTADSVTVVCANNRYVTMARPRSANVSSSRRVLCSRCDSPPAFFVNNRSLPVPETSYGTLWRWSPSRLLARDLRMKLCGNATECPAATGWTMDNFWRQYKALSVDALFSQPGKVDDDSAVWSKPWLLCTKSNASSGKICSGTMSKAAWQGGDRTQTCRAVLAQPNAALAAVDMSICDLDARMNALCKTIQWARYGVFEANCRLTGRCRTTAFFYQPATYSLDDGQFVRSTVGQFYNFTAPGSCPVTDAETLAVLASNAHAVQNCPAQDLEALSLAIDSARAVVHFFVKIIYYMGVIGLELMSLIAGGGDAAIRTVMIYFGLIASEFQAFFAALGDVAFKLIMETGKLGQFMRAVVTNMCYFLRDVYMAVIQPFVCLIKSGVVVLLDAVVAVIGALSFVSGGALAGTQAQITNARNLIDAARVCGEDGNPFADCDGFLPTDESPPTALPMPTRCWVGYQPAIGDQGGLGCTAADTCMDDDGTLRACASCVGGSGCDSLTKLCRFIIAGVYPFNHMIRGPIIRGVTSWGLSLRSDLPWMRGVPSAWSSEATPRRTSDWSSASCCRPAFGRSVPRERPDAWSETT